jgi:hypothetical protein
MRIGEADHASPPSQTGRAVFPHQMLCNTFDA